MQTSKWWHIGLSSQGRQTLFESETLRRKALRHMVAAAPDETLLYGIIDDHLHHIVTCDSQRAAKITRRLRLSLGPVACCRFEPSFVEAISSRQHLQHLVRYVLTQIRHHELVEHLCPVDRLMFPGSGRCPLAAAPATATWRASAAAAAAGYPANGGATGKTDRAILAR